ncbi:hypothetical protein [Streptomyces longisporus]|uniref:Uncharacterized protein n=1 Tax=Streptomyces longisporus TaxID=1948 RepID=A0ABN3LGG7_STRLO
MKHVMERAGVALHDVCATTGRKPALFRELIETALSGTGHAIPAQQRAYVQAIREALDAATKISIYAGALRDEHSPGIAHRRAVNTREFAPI